MKRDFTNENFERFLKQSADSLRMKAPEKVWQNLSRELNKRRRRWIFGLSAFLFIASTVGYFIIANDTTNGFAVSLQSNKQLPIINSNSELAKENKPVVFSLVTQQSTKSLLSNKELKQAIEKNLFAENSIAVSVSKSLDTDEISLTEEAANKNNFIPTVVDSYTEFDQQTISGKKEIGKNDIITTSVFPLTIESVINSYKEKRHKAKIEKQFYFTPTVSYRKLSENKSYLRTLDPANIPSNLPAFHSSVNNNVTHKPDLGFELGFTTKIPVSDKLKLRSGIQFNVNRYDVKAFSSPLSIATIALNNGPRVDSLNTVSGYSNVHGYKSNWLQNFSFQVSVPIGIEYNFSNNDNVQVGLATTLQPTYVLGDRAYLITTDYKSYTQVPWLIRRWNVNTAVEAFVKYKSWQVGPQMRYQLLSSFISKYPVKENLFDFGLKVGVTLK